MQFMFKNKNSLFTGWPHSQGEKTEHISGGRRAAEHGWREEQRCYSCPPFLILCLFQLAQLTGCEWPVLQVRWHLWSPGNAFWTLCASKAQSLWVCSPGTGECSLTTLTLKPNSLLVTLFFPQKLSVYRQKVHNAQSLWQFLPHTLRMTGNFSARTYPFVLVGAPDHQGARVDCGFVWCNDAQN